MSRMITRLRTMLLASVTLAILALVFLLVPRWNVAGQPQGSTLDVQAIVNQFYPLSLVDDAEPEGEGRVPLSRLSAFVVFDQFQDGTPQTIIAAYSNGSSGAIRVIRADANRSYNVVFEPENFDLGGTDCEATLVDVEPDGVSEILVSFRSYRGPSGDWIFRWDGTRLVNLGPTREDAGGVKFSLLSDSGFMDLDHTGTLSLVTLTGTASLGNESPNPLPVVYKLEDGRFVLDRPLLFLFPFVRRPGQPETVEQTLFVPPGSSGSFVLNLINGERDGSRRVSSARIVLNGTEILSPDQFSQQIEFFTIPVSLRPENKIEVTLAGIPLGQVWISIQDEVAVQRARQTTAQP